MKKLLNLVVAVVLISTYACKDKPKLADQPLQEKRSAVDHQFESGAKVNFTAAEDLEKTNSEEQILRPGIFHADEVEEGVDKLKWFGLFQNDSGYYLAETKIRTTRVHDDMADEFEEEKTAWKVEVLHADETNMLITGLDFLKNRTVEQYSLAQNSLLPNEQLKFSHLGLDYHLYAKGEIKQDPEDPENSTEILKYQLNLSVKKGGRWVNDVLIEEVDVDGTTIGILFVGDIDGDQVLDFIIDTSNHYNSSCPTLYLSRPAEPGHIIKLVGMHCSSGC